jgi:uncharacterized membrane protein YqjE
MAVHEPDIRVERGNGSRFSGTWNEEPPVGDLFRQLAEDATTLIRQEVALGKAEIRETARELGRDAAKVGVAAALALLGALAATAFLIVALGDLLDNYWLSSLIVAVVFLSIGGILGRNAIKDVKSRDMKPARTIQTLQADAQWAKSEVAEVKREWKS